MKERGQRIKIVWRAAFQQPKGLLNPGGFKVPMPVEVEICQFGRSWIACCPTNKQIFRDITPQLDAATIKAQMHLYFENQLSEWSPFRLQDGKAIPIAPDGFYTDEQGHYYLPAVQKGSAK